MGVNKLNPRQEQFKNNLLKGMGEQDAYEAVDGYTAKGKVAAAAASRLLKNVKFAAEYNKAKEKAANRAVLSKERVLREDCRIAYSDVGELFNGPILIAPADLPEDVRRAIASVKVTERSFGDDETIKTYEYKFWDKGRSIDRLERHLGLFEKDNEQKKPEIIVADAIPPEKREALTKAYQDILKK